MSVAAMSWVLEHTGDMDAGRRMVLVAAADYANEHGYFFTANKTLAEKASCAPKTVQRALQDAEERGWLCAVDPKAKDLPRAFRAIRGDKRPRIWQFTFTGGQTVTPPEPVANNPTDSGDGWTAGGQRVDSQVSTDPKNQEPSYSKNKVDTSLSTSLAPSARKLSPQQEIMEALVQACEWNRDEITPKKWKYLAAAAADLRGLPQPPEPAEVVRRGRNYQINHPEWARTPTALVSHWADSAEIRRKPSDREVAAEMRLLEWQNTPADHGGRQ